jgi:hypothetical protein
VRRDGEAHLAVPDILECLAGLVGDTGRYREAARLFGAAQAIGGAAEHRGGPRA